MWPAVFGVDETAGEYLSAGAALAGAGNTFLATAGEIETSDWSAVTAKAASFIDAVKTWQDSHPGSRL